MGFRDKVCPYFRGSLRRAEASPLGGVDGATPAIPLFASLAVMKLSGVISENRRGLNK
jgi:hypothetical protein